MWVALYRFAVLAMLVAILALLVLHTGDLASEVRLVQLRVERVEAAGRQHAEAVAAVEGRVERLQASLTEQEERLKLLRRDADRIAEHGQAIGALQDQAAASLRDAQGLKGQIAAQGELGQALQGRTEELTTTVGELTRTADELTKAVQALADQVGRPQLPTFPFPIPIPLRP
jgi:chromosome segregation ATPase